MKTLRELMRSRSDKVRLQAAMRASEILLEHQRSEERIAIATERAAARKAEAEQLAGGSQASEQEPPAVTQQPVPADAERGAREFLERMRKG